MQIKNNNRYAGASNWTMQASCFLSLLLAHAFFFLWRLAVGASRQMELFHCKWAVSCHSTFYVNNIALVALMNKNDQSVADCSFVAMSTYPFLYLVI